MWIWKFNLIAPASAIFLGARTSVYSLALPLNVSMSPPWSKIPEADWVTQPAPKHLLTPDCSPGKMVYHSHGGWHYLFCVILSIEILNGWENSVSPKLCATGRLAGCLEEVFKTWEGLPTCLCASLDSYYWRLRLRRRFSELLIAVHAILSKILFPRGVCSSWMLKLPGPLPRFSVHSQTAPV